MKNTKNGKEVINYSIIGMMLILLIVLYIRGIAIFSAYSCIHFAVHFFGMLETLVIYNGSFNGEKYQEGNSELFDSSVILASLACFFCCCLWLLNGSINSTLFLTTMLFLQYIVIMFSSTFMFAYFRSATGKPNSVKFYFFEGIFYLSMIPILLSNDFYYIENDQFIAGKLIFVPALLNLVHCILFAIFNRNEFNKFKDILIPFGLMCSVSLCLTLWTKNLEFLIFFICASQMLGMCRSFLLEEEYNHYINSKFETFVSSVEVEKAIRSQNMLKEGGERIATAILYCRLRNFDELEKNGDLNSITTELNLFIKNVTECVEYEKGIVMDIPEYAVLSCFGIRDKKQNYTLAAVRAALQIQKKINELNTLNMQNNLPTLSIGLSVVYGESVVGNIGTYKHMRYSAISGIVNMCSRIESMAFENELVITEDAKDKCEGKIIVGEPRKIRVKGFPKSISFYSVETGGIRK